MVTEKDIGKIAYNLSWQDGSIEKGVLDCIYYGSVTHFFIIKKEKGRLLKQYVFSRNTFVKKREIMSFLKKYSCFDKKKSEFVYFGSHRIMLKDLFRKIKDL